MAAETKGTCPNPHCQGGLIQLPRGMSPGFYAFMGAGCRRRDDGTLLMRCPACENHRKAATPEDDTKGR